jgi:hypothetical protein
VIKEMLSPDKHLHFIIHRKDFSGLNSLLLLIDEIADHQARFLAHKKTARVLNALRNMVINPSLPTVMMGAEARMKGKARIQVNRGYVLTDLQEFRICNHVKTAWLNPFY